MTFTPSASVDYSTFANSPFDISGMISALSGMPNRSSASYAAPIIQNGTLINPIVNAQGTFSSTLYASYDPTLNPSPIQGWLDFSFHAYSFDPASLAVVSDDIWATRLTTRYEVLDGVVIPYVAPIPTISEQIATALANLASVRFGHEVGGVRFVPSDPSIPPFEVSTDRDSQAKFSAAFVMKSNGYWQDGTPWKVADGSFVAMSAQMIMAVAVTAAKHVAECFGVESFYANAINASSSPLDIDTSMGWPV